MKNRGSFLLLLLLALAGNTNLSAQTAALQVQVYDFAGLSPAELHAFIERTQQILVSSGVRVEVDLCARGEMPCESRSGSQRQLVMRVVSAPPGEAKNNRWQHLGQSIAGPDGGTYGTVFAQQAQRQAAEANLSWIVVLAYAASHEVGHLLLGDQAHTARGLMKAHWEQEDFQSMAQSRLHFSPEQTRELNSRYGAGRPADAGEGTAMASKR